MRAPLAVLVTCLLLPAAAGAQVPVPPPGGSPPPQQPPPAPAPAPAPPPAPAKARLALRVQGALSDRGRLVTIPGQRLKVRGVLTPYVAGQKVVVRVYRGKKKLLVRSVAVRAAGGGAGHFTVGVASGKPGALRVRASHRATPALGTAVATPRKVKVLRLHVSPGGRGPLVRMLQHALAALHYAVPLSGRFDGGTARAVITYRKVNGLARTPRVDRTVFRRLARGVGAFRARYPGHGHHVEADLSRQVLALIVGDRVERVYHMSSGKPSTPTVQGSFHFYSKAPGTNAKGMFDSNYFVGGYAVHGYPEVPVYAASHGCLRIPNADAPSVFRWIRVGDAMDVYP